jgi:hypothetical protein
VYVSAVNSFINNDSRKKPPFNCPFSYCRFSGRNVQDLVYHYAGPDHHVFQKVPETGS